MSTSLGRRLHTNPAVCQVVPESRRLSCIFHRDLIFPVLLTRGELVFLQQHHVGHAQFGEVVQGVAPDAPST